jgi:hypothetical protein
MGLHFYLTDKIGAPIADCDFNITHNLAKMAREAREANLYNVLWHPDEIGCETAGQAIDALRAGLADLRERPEHFKKFDSSNGWGVYENFVDFVQSVLLACERYRDAKIEVSR